MSTFESKRQLANGISAFAVAAALMVASPAYAQTQTATLQGRVEGAAAGTQVVATDNNTGRKVDGNGRRNRKLHDTRPHAGHLYNQR